MLSMPSLHTPDDHVRRPGTVSGEDFATTPTRTAKHCSQTPTSWTRFHLHPRLGCFPEPSSAFWSTKSSGRSSYFSMNIHFRILSANLPGTRGRPSLKNTLVPRLAAPEASPDSDPAVFRRQTAAMGLRDWATVNALLYTICFTGKARQSQRCDNCLSAAHKTTECYALGEEEPDVAGQVHAMESALLAFSATHGSPGPRDLGNRRCAGCITRGAVISGIVNTGTFAVGTAGFMQWGTVERGRIRGRAP